jgi:hypothetical protein
MLELSTGDWVEENVSNVIIQFFCWRRARERREEPTVATDGRGPTQIFRFRDILSMTRQAINSEDLETMHYFQVRKLSVQIDCHVGHKYLCSALSAMRLCEILPAPPAAPPADAEQGTVFHVSSYRDDSY